jgi:toxin ParE1/3/4
MARVLKREGARRDLVAQWVWYAEHATLDIADRFLQAADDALVLLSTQPESGVLFPARKAELQGIRRFPIAGFEAILLFYFPLDNGIDLVRVVHGSRDLEQLFSESSFG